MEIKQKKAILVASVLAIVGIVWLYPVVAGNLEPSAAPGPTMKTLDEVEPRIAINAVNTPGDGSYEYIISSSGSYYLTGNVAASLSGIRINADDVKLDLMGYTLIGPGKASGTNYGVSMLSRSNVEIGNGTIREFGSHGINGAGSTSRQHRIINVRAVSNGFYGIYLSSQSNLIKDCAARDNGGTGIYTSSYSTVTGCLSCYNTYDGIAAGSGSVVTDNNASYNSLDGIDAQNGSTITNNTATFNDACGIYAWAQCVLIGNTANNNDAIGIRAWYGSTVTNNSAGQNGLSGIEADKGSTVIGNTARNNTGNGITIRHQCMAKDNNCWNNGYSTGDGAGIYIAGDNARVESNNVCGNDRGIEAPYAGNIIVRNTATGNGTNYDIVAGNAIGPILDYTAGGTITSTNPWANFEF